MREFESLRIYLDDMVQPPEKEWLAFRDSLKIKKLEKNEFFFRQGERCPDVGFVQDGLLASFYTDDHGVKYVKKFSPTGNPVSCYASQILNSSTHYSCQALRKTTLVCVEYDRLKSFFGRHMCWERLGRLMAERLYIDKELREHEFLVADAKSRYEIFLDRFKSVADEIPQYLIASYIGVTPESLSRIKSSK